MVLTAQKTAFRAQRNGCGIRPVAAAGATMLREAGQKKPPMRKLVAVSLVHFLALGCGSASHRDPNTPGSAGNGDSDVAGSNPQSSSGSVKQTDEPPKKSETADWWKVAHPEVDDNAHKSTRQIGRVVVNSDPVKHGDALRLRFTVNGTKVSGVFQAPGGKSSTFSIPAGTVMFTVDECDGEEQGFPLAAGEEIAMSCKLTREGDCCEIAIPVEDEKPVKKGKTVTSHAVGED